MAFLIRRDHRDPSPLGAFERLFNDPFFSELPALARMDEGTLPLDVSENDTHVIVRASLPGFAKDKIDIEVHDGVLAINAHHEEEREEKGERFYRKERRSGSLSRRVALPSTVLEKDAQAEFNDGVLTLRLPKVQKEQPKKIRIG
ncbi:MAG: Hsp20/alpha crystallin family protein [Planctomycetota bacterium]|nr:Hsp20/alpha crystallin family protein [Planctomycetota bacterium]